MTTASSKPERAAELNELRARLAEAEEVLHAIRNGDVDAVVVSGGHGEQIYTLSGADHVYRSLIESMSDGALTLSADGVIQYANQTLARLLQAPLERVIGAEFRAFVSPADQPVVAALIAAAWRGNSRGDVSVRAADGSSVPLHLGLSRLELSPETLVGVVATDLTEERKREDELRQARSDLERRVEERTAELSVSRLAALNMMEEAVEAQKAAEATNRRLEQEVAERKRGEEQIKRHVADLERAFMSTVQVATTLSEMRDPYTAGHERRVAEVAVAIGAELGFDARRQQGLRVAGYLHDIGKITIPSEILSKPGKLNSTEFQLIQGHAQASYDVLKDVEFPWPVAQVALQHHERIDGSGYPQRLKGEAILLEARIMAVADVVEAMSSHRPYRAGLGIEKALAEIERGRGTAYDASVADACLKLFREKGYVIPS